ncbi:uncharacterized protein F4812DRAFT_276902 [Daldinia caldariorum]|uniref:uncharacterized protein n=1 Tax=Daldinia caldariorum TaxID=326644 RepID=UPI002007DB88|nr:uncharacterized protein F4812DRAFT_276902 [Daldinia caldariorum]KAI1470741.1 hypothetical protein F4812DRAFT_276902 [Daldinia caldariorum]
MDYPEQQIQHIIRSLTQYSHDDQRTALQDYFLPDAYFVHPFCRVPSFGNCKIPYTDLTVNSRQLVFYIYQWYRILSPDIKLSIDSTSFDKDKNLLYVMIRQTFTLWFVPLSLWQANVKLVTVLELQQLSTDKSHKPLLGETSTPVNGERPPKLYFIKGQQDHYQIEDFLQFVAPWGASLLWMAWQIYATIICTVGVIFLRTPVALCQKYFLGRDTRAIKTL